MRQRKSRVIQRRDDKGPITIHLEGPITILVEGAAIHGAMDCNRCVQPAKAVKAKRRGPSLRQCIDEALAKAGREGLAMKVLWDIVSVKWHSPNGKTPENSMRSSIYHDMKDKGNKTKYRQLQNGNYVLR